MLARTITVLVAVIGCAMLLAVTWNAGISSALWGAFRAQSDGGSALLALRVGLLVAVVFELGERRERSTIAAVAVALLFVASLAWVVLVVPFAAVCLVLLTWRALGPAGDAENGRRRAWTLFAVVTVPAALLLVSSTLLRPRTSAETPMDVARETARWLERDNLFRAREAATEWVNAERQRPGEPDLILARIEWALGHRALARRRAEDVAAHGAAPEVVAHAAQLIASWAGAPDGS